MERAFFLYDPTLSMLLRRPYMSLNEIYFFHIDFPFLWIDLENLSRFAFFFSCNDLDGVSFFDSEFWGSLFKGLICNLTAHHNTSGAKEMIFMNFFQRSSRATGPKIRVPIGSP